jgi:hypothetical protein
MTATARLSDASIRDVTSSSAWTTSNVSLAVVPASGLVTVAGSGEVDVRATYQRVIGTMKLVVSAAPPQPSYSLSGVVHEVSPNARALSNVRVEITGGSAGGGFTMTDAGGFFRFDALTGVVSMQAVRNGFRLWQITNLIIDRDRQLEVVLYPAPPTNAGGATSTARCNDGSWSWSASRLEACTSNGGIAYGVCPGALCNALTPSK